MVEPLSYAPNFEKVGGAYCFWLVTFLYLVPIGTFKPLKLEQIYYEQKYYMFRSIYSKQF